MDLLIVVISALLCSALTLPVHEIGHGIAAKIMGWEFHFVSFFGFTFEHKDGEGFKVRREKTGSYFFGVILTLPRYPALMKIWHYLFYLFGGAMINFIIFLLLLVVGILSNNFYVKLFSIIPIGNTISSLVPCYFGMLQSDGMQILNSLREKSRTDVIRLMVAFAKAEVDGLPVPVLTNDELTVLRLAKGRNARYLGYALSYLRCKESADTNVANEFLSELKLSLAKSKQLRAIDSQSYKIGDEIERGSQNAF
ncbi:MAG: hypothetical protein LBG97_08405 [Coriobacteriales bacterium]|nr:hypothetical protein [Coriobacteriales bacterium]